MHNSIRQANWSWLLAIAIVVFGGAGIIALAPGCGGQRHDAGPTAEHQHPHTAVPEHDHAEEADHDHDGHNLDGHEHDAHDHGAEVTTVELSEQAKKNIGFEPVTIALSTYDKSLTLPGVVAERPGRSQRVVSAPLGGIVTKIYAVEGEAVGAESPLFDIRLTHEELVGAQAELLKSAEQLDVVKRELERLEAITEGVIAGKRILEQRYERQKLEAAVRAQRQALVLHGLSDEQVDNIIKQRKLFQMLTVRAPKHEDDCHCVVEHLFHIRTLNAHLGGQVNAGDPLCILADHCELLIEGTAFEEDTEPLRSTAEATTSVSASLLGRQGPSRDIEGLKVLYLANEVDRESRAMHFYLSLPNDIVLDRRDGDRRFLQWRFRPGQRVEINVPLARLENRIVVPAEAVTADGAENFVFRADGNHFDRVPVHVEMRDRRLVVLANDGSLFPGDVIAARGAYEIHLAIKNKSGGAVDPHAGHTH